MDATELARPRARRLIEAVAGEAAAPALEAPGAAPCSHGALRALLRQAAGALAPLGPGARVVARLPDHPSTAAALAAVCEAACCAPANPAWTAAELEAHARAVGADAVLARADDAAADALAARLGLARLRLTPGTRHAADFSLSLEGAGAPRPEGPAALILPTSGSTGTPKLVPLTAPALLHSARTIAATLRLGPHDRAVHMLPMFHVGAVVDLLLAPLGAGGAARLAHPASTANLLEALRAGGATWLQAAPAMLHGLLAGAGEDALRELGGGLRFVRAVSADLAPEVQAELEDRLGGTPVIQMYGMTETAGQIASNPLPPQARRPGSVGRPDGAEVAVLDDWGNPVAEGREGEVCVRGPAVMAGYENAGDAEHFHGGWLRTGDLGRLEADGFLILTGRAREIVNRGGEKISPREVERALLAHADVADAAAFAVAHPSLGEEMGAAAVLREGAAAGEAALRAHLAGRLADYKAPRRLLILDALPRLGGGKVDKRALRARAEGRAAPAAAAGPATPAGRVTARIWARTLRAEPPGPETDFFDAGGDSLAVQSFVLELERALGVALPANLIYENPRFAELEQALQALSEAGPEAELPDALERAVRAATAGWTGARRHGGALIVERRGAGRLTPLFFCAAHPDTFDRLCEGLDPERPVGMLRPLSQIEHDGRGLQTPANRSRLARAYAREIEEIQPEGPVLIGGMCQGALYAREIGARLRARGREIGLLVQVDRVIDAAWPGPAAMIWSATSRDALSSWFLEPERGLGVLFPAGVETLAVGGRHYGVMTDRRGLRIARFLEPLRAPGAAPGRDPAARAAGRPARRAAAGDGGGGEPLRPRLAAHAGERAAPAGQVAPAAPAAAGRHRGPGRSGGAGRPRRPRPAGVRGRRARGARRLDAGRRHGGRGRGLVPLVRRAAGRTLGAGRRVTGRGGRLPMAPARRGRRGGAVARRPLGPLQSPMRVARRGPGLSPDAAPSSAAPRVAATDARSAARSPSSPAGPAWRPPARTAPRRARTPAPPPVPPRGRNAAPRRR
jgi:acyl-CoA synthetase (AMP-forming)/AMP-acid ligase II/acyl carrier protein